MTLFQLLNYNISKIACGEKRPHQGQDTPVGILPSCPIGVFLQLGSLSFLFFFFVFPEFCKIALIYGYGFVAET